MPEWDNFDLKKAQLRALSTQLPIMYSIILVCGCLLSYEYFEIAPNWVTVYPVLASASLVVPRIFHWLKLDVDAISSEAATEKLKSVLRMAGAIAFAFAVWGMLLYQHGDSLLKAHTAFYMAFSIVTRIFCLGVLPLAAVIIPMIVIMSFFSYSLLQWDALALGALTNVALVCAGMLIVTRQGYVNFKRMVSEQTRSQQLADSNFELASRDNLTKLANRRSFYAHMETECVNAWSSSSRLAVGVIDLDGFKLVNDVHGHMAGDGLLREVGRRLEDFHQDFKHVMFFRTGGDEFAFTMCDVGSDDQIQCLGDKICQVLGETYELNGTKLSISATIGVADFDLVNDRLQDVMEKADFALYKGKIDHVGECILFCDELNGQLRRSVRVKNALKGANFALEIQPAFQPIVDSVDNRVVAFEALARWTSPLLGAVPPDEFISAAEDTGTIGDVTRVMIDKSLSAMSEWPETVGLSINLSAVDVSDTDLLLWFYGQIAKRGIAPDRLNIEVTETAFNADFEQIIENLKVFKNLGCDIALDDFGMGHSSFFRLHHLPLSKIKIDRSFISGLRKGMKNYKIVKSITMLARDMELDCIVEGVETEAELRAIQELGLRRVQGYYYSKPMPQRDVSEYLQKMAFKAQRLSA